MPPARYAVRAGDYRYGHVCPVCASPKTLQAARCRSCYADQRRTGRRRAVQIARARCPVCGGPMWATSRRCRTCWLDAPDPQPQSHPWRKRRVA